MHGDIPSTLRRVHELCRALAGGLGGDPPPELARARDRLERDLLPRTAGDTPYLVVGIVGPNNAGKSALFNSLCGRALSPSVATGGATRRLVGAAHPELLARLDAEPTLSRFPVARASANRPFEPALSTSENPAELAVAEVPALPPELLLIDTPDFDSIEVENRRASESLLAVADLAVVVVTRHSYQNRQVVEYLERWLDHGRPWLLVYNEAPAEDVTREHADKLTDDLGVRPEAVFWQRFDLAVQDGEAELAPVRLDGESEQPVRDFLFDLERVGRLKEDALRASLAQLGDDLSRLAAGLRARARDSEELLGVARAHALVAGRSVAGKAMPGGPFLEALRTVLDRRDHPWKRGLRGGLRSVGSRVTGLVSRLRFGKTPDVPPAQARLAKIEREELEAVFARFFEELVRDLGPEARAEARGRVPSDVARALDADLWDGRRVAARVAACEALGAGAGDEFEAFEQVCEELVERALDERGRDWDLQLAVDFATALPIAVAALIIVKTGGLGLDLGVAGGGAVTSFLGDRYAHFLGAGITREARRRWTELRSVELAEHLVRTTLPTAAGELDALAQRANSAADELDELALTLATS